MNSTQGWPITEVSHAADVRQWTVSSSKEPECFSCQGCRNPPPSLPWIRKRRSCPQPGLALGAVGPNGKHFFARPQTHRQCLWNLRGTNDIYYRLYTSGVEWKGIKICLRNCMWVNGPNCSTFLIYANPASVPYISRSFMQNAMLETRGKCYQHGPQVLVWLKGLRTQLYWVQHRCCCWYLKGASPVLSVHHYPLRWPSAVHTCPEVSTWNQQFICAGATCTAIILGSVGTELGSGSGTSGGSLALCHLIACLLVRWPRRWGGEFYALQAWLALRPCLFLVHFPPKQKQGPWFPRAGTRKSEWSLEEIRTGANYSV